MSNGSTVLGKRKRSIDPGRRYRNYFFTYNNPPKDWDPKVLFEKDKAGTAEGECADAIRYLAGQFERGDNRTLHFQGYVVFRNTQGLPGCRKIMQAATAHFEQRQGSHIQALAYVTKDKTRCPGGEPVILGDPPEQGKRSDLEDVGDAIKDGSTERDIAENYVAAYIKYSTGIRRAIGQRHRPRDAAPEAYFFWGPSETGKSYAAWNFIAPRDQCYAVPLSSGSNIWFDGYDPSVHTTMIFDDYYSNFKFCFLLRLLDGYPMQLPTKGGFIPAAPQKVVFTSNKGLHLQYPNIPDQHALWRRFKHVMFVEKVTWHTCTSSNYLGLIAQS